MPRRCRRLAAVPFACISCEAASDTLLKGCNACCLEKGEDSLEWPRYCNKGCQKDHWQEHRKTCASKQGGGAARREQLIISL